MRLKSTTFRGTWPPGMHWAPGEVRTLPADYPLPKDDDGKLLPLPRGLEQLEDEKPEGGRRRRRRNRPAAPSSAAPAPASASEEASA